MELGRERRRLARGKRAVVTPLAILVLVIPVLSACSTGQGDCPGSASGLSDLTLDKAASLVGTTVATCTTSPTGEVEGPSPFEMDEPWDALFAVDGMALPAQVSLSEGGYLADCNEYPTTLTYLLVGDMWMRARTVTCSQLD